MTTSQFTTSQITVSQSASSGTQIATPTRQVGDDQVRIDENSQSKHHIRAKQLTEFTNWLSNTTQSPKPDQTKVPVQSTIIADAPSTKKVYRVDSPSAVNKPNHPANQFIADPEEIRRIIQKLKSDGRVIADRNQAEDTDPSTNISELAGTTRSLKCFTWPDVTSNLVGSPAILNLEMNIDGPTTQHFKQLLVTATQPGTGATTVAISLARQLAQHGHRVLLVDANISNAAMTSRLGVGIEKSWYHAISQRSALTDIIWHDENSTLSLLPVTPINANVSWQRKIYNELANIIDSIAWDFQYIIFDIGEYEQFIRECTRPGNMADMTLLVNGRNLNGVADQRRAENRLANAGVSELLIVHNFSRIDSVINSKVG